MEAKSISGLELAATCSDEVLYDDGTTGKVFRPFKALTLAVIGFVSYKVAPKIFSGSKKSK